MRFYTLSYGFLAFVTTRFYIFFFFAYFSQFLVLSRYWQILYHIIGIQNKAQLLILKSLRT